MTMEAVVTTRSPRRAKTSGQITATTSIPTYIQRFTGSCRLSYRPIYSVKAWNAIKLFSNSVTATAGMLRITDNVAMSSTLDWWAATNFRRWNLTCMHCASIVLALCSSQLCVDSFWIGPGSRSRDLHTAVGRNESVSARSVRCTLRSTEYTDDDIAACDHAYTTGARSPAPWRTVNDAN